MWDRRIDKNLLMLQKDVREQVRIPVGVSNRHIHLSHEDFSLLFPGEEIEVLKELYQPGFYAAKQTVTIRGPKGNLTNVRLLTPLRENTQVELSLTDARKIGVNAPLRLSGDLEGAATIGISTENTSIERDAGIVAKRHIHMNQADALLLGYKNGEVVSVQSQSTNRSLVFDNVVVRISQGAVLEMHIDTDEANAANVQTGSYVTLYERGAK